MHVGPQQRLSTRLAFLASGLAMVHLAPLDLGGQQLVVVTLRDMTQRQRAEEAMHASSERYRLIVQTAAEGIWMTDADGSLISTYDGGVPVQTTTASTTFYNPAATMTT